MCGQMTLSRRRTEGSARRPRLGPAADHCTNRSSAPGPDRGTALRDDTVAHSVAHTAVEGDWLRPSTARKRLNFGPCGDGPCRDRTYDLGIERRPLLTDRPRP